MENSGLVKKEDLLKELCSFCNSGYNGHCPHPYGTCNEYEIILQFKEIPEINKGKILRLLDEIDYVASIKVSDDAGDNWADYIEISDIERAVIGDIDVSV